MQVDYFKLNAKGYSVILSVKGEHNRWSISSIKRDLASLIDSHSPIICDHLASNRPGRFS